jgi:hypothetical protein
VTDVAVLDHSEVSAPFKGKDTETHILDTSSIAWDLSTDDWNYGEDNDCWQREPTI